MPVREPRRRVECNRPCDGDVSARTRGNDCEMAEFAEILVGRSEMSMLYRSCCSANKRHGYLESLLNEPGDQ